MKMGGKMIQKKLALVVLLMTLAACAAPLSLGLPASTPGPTVPPAVAARTSLLRKAIVQDFVGDWSCTYKGGMASDHLSVKSNLRYSAEGQLEYMGTGERGRLTVGSDSIWLVTEVYWIRMVDSGARVDVTRVPKAEQTGGLELIPVRWGQYRFLVPRDSLTEFCQLPAPGHLLSFQPWKCIYARVWSQATPVGPATLPDGTPVCP
jgi:hypothetical protein